MLLLRSAALSEHAVVTCNMSHVRARFSYSPSPGHLPRLLCLYRAQNSAFPQRVDLLQGLANTLDLEGLVNTRSALLWLSRFPHRRTLFFRSFFTRSIVAGSLVPF